MAEHDSHALVVDTSPVEDSWYHLTIDECKPGVTTESVGAAEFTAVREPSASLCLGLIGMGLVVVKTLTASFSSQRVGNH